MKRSEVQAWLDEANIDCRSISLYCSDDPDDDSGGTDSCFGTCDISGERGMIAPCVALTKDGVRVQFEAGDWLIGGHLGKIAGAF